MTSKNISLLFMLYLKVPNHVYVLKWNIIHCVNVRKKFFHGIKAFPNSPFLCFHWKIIWHLGKVKKKIKSVSNWTDAHFTSFNVPPCLLPINYCCWICTIWCMTFKKRLFTEVLCRPLFTKYAHCKPLFPFENNA